ncbi:MAG: hypothetical protein ABW252_11025 [Polyangiales bacterium]
MATRHAALACALGLALMGAGCDEDEDTPDGTGSSDGGFDAQAGLHDAAAPPLDASDAARPAFNNAFAIHGRIGSAPGDKQLKQAGGDAAVVHAITHIMAVNPATANPVRYVQPVAADGSFAIGVDLNAPWVLVLVDATQVGRAMIAGVFRGDAFDLDSVAATRPGTLDLGSLDIDESTLAARATVSTSTLLSSLGLTESGATLLGALDDVSLRYVNPDIDGNGKVDALEGVAYPLDFHLRYDMRNGSQDVALVDLLAGFTAGASARARYTVGSAIVSWDPRRFGATSPSDYRVRFPSFGGSFSAPPLSGTFGVGEWITGVNLYLSAGSSSVGVSFDATQPFPTGEYVYEVQGTALTFTDVRTHTLPELNAGDGLILPFLKVDPAVAGCTGWSCAVTGFGYQWMKRDGEGFTPATAEEVALVVPQGGGFITFVLGSDTNKRLSYTIPGSPATGTIALTATAFPPENVVPADLTNLTVDKICQLGVSYDDTLGMRIFLAWRAHAGCAF